LVLTRQFGPSRSQVFRDSSTRRYLGRYNLPAKCKRTTPSYSIPRPRPMRRFEASSSFQDQGTGVCGLPLPRATGRTGKFHHLRGGFSTCGNHAVECSALSQLDICCGISVLGADGLEIGRQGIGKGRTLVLESFLCSKQSHLTLKTELTLRECRANPGLAGAHDDYSCHRFYLSSSVRPCCREQIAHSMGLEQRQLHGHQNRSSLCGIPEC